MRLAEAGIPFRIVPGVSAGIGGPAYAGIPLTHRNHNSVGTFLTGQGTGGGVPDGIDWGAISRGSPVIVMYMVVKQLTVIAAKLIAAGRDPGEPVAIISHATTADQQVLETKLGECAEAAARAEPPAVVVVGSVVSFRSYLDWLGNLQGAPHPLPGSE